MTNAKKQLKLTKLFRKDKTAATSASRLPEDCEELQREVQELEQKLKEKQNDLFQLQRNSYRRRMSPPKSRAQPFVRPQKIILANAVEKLKSDIELMSQLSGMEVQSYVAEEHCSIIYHMQHQTDNQVKHGLRINMKAGASDIEKYSLPLGFNLSAVMDDFDNVKTPECLGAIRKALVAYYDRLEQFQALNRLVNIEAQLFKLLDGSHIEVTLTAKNETDEEDVIDVTLALDYRVYDIRPKNYSIRETGLHESAAEVLKQQCIVFKRKPLSKAFKQAFIDGCGPYKLVQQFVREELPRRRPRPREPRNQHNDDTFRPEDYSESEDEDIHQN